MKRILKVIFGFILLLGGISNTLAASMQCGTQFINDDQRDGQSKDKILAMCGEPETKEGNTWYYKKPDGAMFRLHFNGSGELESIQETVE